MIIIELAAISFLGLTTLISNLLIIAKLSDVSKGKAALIVRLI